MTTDNETAVTQCQMRLLPSPSPWTGQGESEMDGPSSKVETLRGYTCSMAYCLWKIARWSSSMRRRQHNMRCGYCPHPDPPPGQGEGSEMDGETESKKDEKNSQTL